MTTVTLPAHMTVMEADVLREFHTFVMTADEAQPREALFSPAAQAKRQATKKRRPRRGIGSY